MVLELSSVLRDRFLINDYIKYVADSVGINYFILGKISEAGME